MKLTKHFALLIFLYTVGNLAGCGEENTSHTLEQTPPKAPAYEIDTDTLKAHMPFSGRSIDTKLIFALAKLDTVTMIQTMNRIPGLKVLTLNKRNDQYPAEDLPYSNPEELKEDVEELTALYGDEVTLGMHIAPYLQQGAEASGKDRPLLDQHLILIIRNADHHAVLHEFLHFLLNVRHARKNLAKDGDKIVNILDRFDLKSSTENTFAAINAFSEDRNQDTWEKSFYLVGNHLKMLDQWINTQCEELDITRFMIKHSKKLRSTQMNYIFDFQYHMVNLGTGPSPEAGSFRGKVNMFDKFAPKEPFEVILEKVPQDHRHKVEDIFSVNERIRVTLPKLGEESNEWVSKEWFKIISDPENRKIIAEMARMRMGL